jgi:hypothetical protein
MPHTAPGKRRPGRIGGLGKYSSGIFWFRPQDFFRFHPHHVDNAEGTGQQNSQYPGEIPHFIYHSFNVKRLGPEFIQPLG